VTLGTEIGGDRLGVQIIGDREIVVSNPGRGLSQSLSKYEILVAIEGICPCRCGTFSTKIEEARPRPRKGFARARAPQLHPFDPQRIEAPNL
jgi:hypothetical protein